MQLRGVKKLFLLITVLLACSAVCAAQDEDTTSLYLKGAGHLKARRWAEAERAFAEVLRTWPRQPDVHALLGIARCHLGKYRSAIGNLEFALRNGTKYKPRVLYYLGMAYSMLGQEEMAVNAFERLIARYPNSPEARKTASSTELKALKRVSEPKKKPEKVDRLKFLLIQDVNHDSNALMAPDPKDDMLLFTFASAKLSLHPVPIFLKYSFMVQEYFKEDDLDLVYLAGTAQGKFQLSENDTICPAYTLKNLWLADKDLGSGKRYELLWKRNWWKNLFSDVLLSYGQNFYDENYKDEVTGDRKEGRIRLWWNCEHLRPLTRIRISGILSDSTAEEDHLEYQSWAALLEIELSLSAETSLDFEYGYGERDYAEIHPDYGLVRHDHRVRVGASLLAELDKGVFLRFNIHSLSSDSSIRDHTYNQTVYGAGLMFMF